MEESGNFEQELQAALSKKAEWFNGQQLPQTLGDYRMLHTIVKNLFELLTKKSLIIPDPYRLDKRISEIVIPDTKPFPEGDIAKEMGLRFSDYELMLDFICTYFRFSLDNLTLPKIKKLVEFNACIEWDNLSPNSAKPNTKSLAMVISNAKSGAQPVMVSMLGDAIQKSSDCLKKINSEMAELVAFQKESYKGQIRQKIIANPGFNKEAASTSEGELAEIKRLFPKLMGKTPLYNDLVGELIKEDFDSKRDKLREDIFARLQIKAAVKKEETTKKKGPDTKAMLIETVFAIGGLAPTIQTLHQKLEEDFKILFSKKQGFFKALAAAFKRAFKLKEKELTVTVTLKDPKTEVGRSEVIKVNEFMSNIASKSRIYNGIAVRGPEFSKIMGATEESILGFVTKQLSEAKMLFSLINALDIHFKKEVEVINRPKLKGLQIELSALRNSIVAINKKRGEYLAVKEEHEQMKNLGMSTNEK